MTRDEAIALAREHYIQHMAKAWTGCPPDRLAADFIAHEWAIDAIMAAAERAGRDAKRYAYHREVGGTVWSINNTRELAKGKLFDSLTDHTIAEREAQAVVHITGPKP